MSVSVYTRVKIEEADIGTLLLQLGQNQLLYDAGLTQGVQLNIGHKVWMFNDYQKDPPIPKESENVEDVIEDYFPNTKNPLLLHRKVPDESFMLRILNAYSMPYTLHGPAGSCAVDLGTVLDEFEGLQERIKMIYATSGKSLNWMEYNREAVSYSVEFGYKLERMGKLAEPSIILHPGFSRTGRVGYYAFPNIIETLKGLRTDNLVWEVIPGWHGKYLKQKNVRNRKYWGLGCQPIDMEYFLTTLEESGIPRRALCLDMTHINVTANQALAYPEDFRPYSDSGDSGEIMESLVFGTGKAPGFLDSCFETAPIIHVSGPTQKIVDEHPGFTMDQNAGYVEVTKRTIKTLEERHGIVNVILEYGLMDSQINKFLGLYIPD